MAYPHKIIRSEDRYPKAVEHATRNEREIGLMEGGNSIALTLVQHAKSIRPSSGREERTVADLCFELAHVALRIHHVVFSYALKIAEHLERFLLALGIFHVPSTKECALEWLLALVRHVGFGEFLIVVSKTEGQRLSACLLPKAV